MEAVSIEASVRNLMVSLPAGWGDAALLPVRLVTYSAVHFGIWHFIANLLCLFFFGAALGKKRGWLKVGVLYFIGAIAGGLAFLLAAWLCGAKGVTLCGASSAVLAITGASAVMIPDFRYRAPVIDRMSLRGAAIATVLIVFATSESVFSACAHAGGIITGLILGYLYCNRTLRTSPDNTHAEEGAASTGEGRDTIDKLRRSGYASLTAVEKRSLKDRNNN